MASGLNPIMHYIQFHHSGRGLRGKNPPRKTQSCDALGPKIRSMKIDSGVKATTFQGRRRICQISVAIKIQNSRACAEAKANVIIQFCSKNNIMYFALTIHCTLIRGFSCKKPSICAWEVSDNSLQLFLSMSTSRLQCSVKMKSLQLVSVLLVRLALLRRPLNLIDFQG